MANKPSINRSFELGFQIGAKNYVLILGNYIILSIMLIISGITIIGILLWPAFYYGYYGSLINVARGNDASIGDFFKIGFGKFFESLGASILYILGITIGFIILIIPGIYFLVGWFYVPYLILDKNASVGEAFTESMRLVHNKSGWWKTFCVILFVFLIILSLNIFLAIPFLGLLIVTIGPVVLMPFLQMVYVIYYLDTL